jgi:hypothetical protein
MVFTCIHGKQGWLASVDTSAWGGFTDTFVIHANIYSMKHLCRRVFDRRGFTIIVSHYNSSRAFINSSSININGTLPLCRAWGATSTPSLPSFTTPSLMDLL